MGDRHEDTRARPAVLAIASSAGGVTALRGLLSGLPADFSVPVVLVQHLDPHHRTHLVEVLQRHTDLEVTLVEEGQAARAGTVHVAPPDHHVRIDRHGVLSLSAESKVSYVRPSADVLFASVAASFGERAVVCVLTGSGRDGATGAAAVGAAGGTVIVQDPETAEFAAMPRAAIATGAADLVLPLAEIPAALSSLCDGKRV